MTRMSPVYIPPSMPDGFWRSGSETTFDEDLTDPARIEAGVLAMADDVWAWFEKTGGRGRTVTVTVKIKWADFQQSTRSQSLPTSVASRATLHEASLGLIRSVFPPPKGIRLVGVTLSNLKRPAFEAAHVLTNTAELALGL